MNDPIRPPVLPGSDPRDLFRRPGVITLLSVLHGLMGAAMLVLGGLGLATSGGKPLVLGIGAATVVLALLNLGAAFGLWTLKGYGRTLLMVFSCIGLLALPFGTIVSILLLIYLTRPGMKVLFSEADPSRLSGDQVAALREVRTSGLGIAVGVMVVVFGLFFGVGVMAAIAIPNFVNAVQRAKQKRAVADLQTVGERLEDFARASGSYPEGRSVDDLAGALGAGTTVTIPTTDPWGHPYLYVAFKSTPRVQGPDAYLLASAGMDGAWEETGDAGYEKGVVASFNGDIVYSNGEFVRAPAALQSSPTSRP